LRGDLDNILLKALKKSPGERYPTAEAFAEDLRRYLNHQPIRARPDSWSYRMAKFVARNKLSVGAATLVLVTILVATGFSVRQAIEATRQRDRALALAARNEAVIDFVTSMLTEVAPAEQPVRVADLLERSQSILLQQDTLPEHRAAILGLLSGYYLSSGKPAQADALLSRSLELTQGTQDGELRAALLCDTAYAASLLGRPADASKLIEQGLASGSPYPMAAVRCLRSRAYIAQNTNDPQAALEYALRAQARLKELPIPKPDIEAELFADIAAAKYLSGRSAEAERFYAQAMAGLVKIGRGESPGVFFLRNNWGLASLAAGDNRHALDQFDEALRIAVQRSIGGEPPPYLLLNRAFTLSTLGRYPEALQAFDVAIESATRAGNMNVRVGGLASRANTYLLMGDVKRATLELAEITPQIGKTISPDSVPAINIMQAQARVDAAGGRLKEALAGLTKVIGFFDGRNMAGAPVVRALTTRCELHMLEGNAVAAMADAQRALEVSRHLQGDKPYSSLTGLALLSMATIQDRTGQHATAQVLAGQAVPHLVETLGPEHPDTLRAAALSGSRAAVPDTGQPRA
jgi:tetratricopeptide (TPR) repeat protein